MVGDVGMQIWAWHPGLDQISAKDDSIWHENFEQQPPSADSGAIIGPKKKKNKKKQKVTAALQLFSFVGVGDCLANVKVVVADGPTPDWNDSFAVRDVSERWAFLGAAWFYDSRGHYVVWYWDMFRKFWQCINEIYEGTRPYLHRTVEAETATKKGPCFCDWDRTSFFLLGYRTYINI